MKIRNILAITLILAYVGFNEYRQFNKGLTTDESISVIDMHAKTEIIYGSVQEYCEETYSHSDECMELLAITE
jgi:hypothetical protein